MKKTMIAHPLKKHLLECLKDEKKVVYDVYMSGDLQKAIDCFKHYNKNFNVEHIASGTTFFRDNIKYIGDVENHFFRLIPRQAMPCQ